MTVEVTEAQVEAVALAIYAAHSGLEADDPRAIAEWVKLPDEGWPTDGLFRLECLSMARAAIRAGSTGDKG